MSDNQKLSLDDQLCFALFAATNAIAQSYRPKLEEIGITYPEYLVMLVIWQDGEVSVRDVSKRLSLSETAARRFLKRLESAGFLNARACDNDIDEGSERFVLSDAGRDLEIGAARVWNGIVCQTQMSMDDLSRLRMELMGLTQRMKAESEENKEYFLDNLLEITK